MTASSVRRPARGAERGPEPSQVVAMRLAREELAELDARAARAPRTRSGCEHVAEVMYTYVRRGEIR